jgi:hypothetical protein
MTDTDTNGPISIGANSVLEKIPTIEEIENNITKYSNSASNRLSDNPLPIDDVISVILFLIITFLIPYQLDKKNYNIILFLILISIFMFIIEKIDIFELEIFKTPQLNNLDFRKLIFIHLFLIIFSAYFAVETPNNNLINLFPKKDNVKETTIFILYYLTNIYKLFLIFILIIKLFRLERDIDSRRDNENKNLFLILQFFVLIIISLLTAIIFYSKNTGINNLKILMGLILVASIFLFFIKAIYDYIIQSNPDDEYEQNFYYLNRNIINDKNQYNAFNNLQNYLMLSFLLLSMYLALIEFTKRLF